LPYFEALLRRLFTEAMNLRTIFAFAVPLLVLACDKDKRKKPSTDDTASTHDTGPAPATDPDCDSGYLDDEGECVPAACGTGTWGDLEVDESTVYVDITATEDGDGSEAAPFTSIQAGLDAAADVDGAMVAVAAGTYPETLELDRSHDAVHLAGRCRELVIIDAGVGDESTVGIFVDVRSFEVEISGVTVSGSQYVGVLVGSGAITIRDSAVAVNEYVGVWAYQARSYATALTMEASEVRENTTMGVAAMGSGTSVSLRETTIEDSQPMANGEGGYGIQVSDGASLDAEGCEVRGNTNAGVTAVDSGTSASLRETSIEDTKTGSPEDVFGIYVTGGASLQAEACEVRRNTGGGVYAADSGTSVTLRETTIEGSQPNENGGDGFGIGVEYEASLHVEACEIRGNAGLGVGVAHSGTSATLQETTIEDTRPSENGEGGYGISVDEGASLHVEACEVRGNTAVGVVAVHSGTSVTLQDTKIDSTMRGEIQTVGIGVAAQYSASVVAVGIEVSSNEGPGFYQTHKDTSLTCSDCMIQDNQFAGAVLLYGASLQLADSFVHGTTEQENIGGGVGIYAQPYGGGPPTLSVTDSNFQDNAIAGVWLSGQGSYSLSDNTIHGGEGWSRESLSKCGDVAYAGEGVTAWDGSSGLLLKGNELLDGLGAGLFLDSASATLSGNSYANNAVDLVTQGADCATPPDGYEAEALSSVELCPAYDYATCVDEFALYLTLEEPESGRGKALAGPPLGAGAPLLPAAPVALPHAFDPTPLLPPVQRVESPRLHPLRYERKPHMPPVVPLTD